MLMTMPCAGVPVATPLRPAALVRAKVAAARTARIAPRTCNSLLRGWRFAHRATLDGADCPGALAQPRSARLVTRAGPNPLGVSGSVPALPRALNHGSRHPRQIRQGRARLTPRRPPPVAHNASLAH